MDRPRIRLLALETQALGTKKGGESLTPFGRG
jgi:hypothetical protein